jgi:DTW domain-containing protein
MRGRRTTVRCPGCQLQLALCLCAELPTLATRTRVVLLLHQLEARKPSNTGRLALRCLPNSALAVRGRAPEAPLAGEAPSRLAAPAVGAAPGWLAGAERPVLLFPHPEADPLERWCDGQPLTLIVPDGTWSQAVRARKRLAGLADIPCAALSGPPRSSYRLRREPRAGRVSTLEAIAHALAQLESPAVAEALLDVQRRAVERTLWASGRLAEDQVWGGIPAAARMMPGRTAPGRTAPGLSRRPFSDDGSGDG